jgi:diguanylate cyclase (GGDEF)-like protein
MLIWLKNDVMKNLKIFIIIFLVSVIGVIVTVHFAYMIYSDQQEKIAYNFQRASGNIIQKIQQTILLSQEPVISITSLFDASTFVSHQEFQTFTSRFVKLQYGIQALEWIPRVTDDQRHEYVKRAREFYPNFEIKIANQNNQLIKAPHRKVYYPVYYVEPYRGNEAVLGFDLSSNPVRLKAMQKAARTNHVAATAPLKLTQGTRQQYGILVFAPIYKNRQLSSFALGVYKINDLLKNSLRLAVQNMNFLIIDITSKNNPILLYNTLKPGFTSQIKFAEIKTKMQKNKLSYQYNARFVDRIWHIYITPRIGYYNIPLGTIFFIIIEILFGLIITSLLSFVVWRFLYQRMQLEQKTDILTKEINQLLYHDRITNLPSRFSVEEMIEKCIANIKATNGKFTVLYIHINNFDLIGQIFGFAAIDYTLKEIALRLKKIISSYEEIAHLENNKFVIITHRDNKQSVLIFIEKINNSINLPITVKNKTFNFTTSIGVAVYPEHGINAEFLLKNSQAAMEKSKQQRGNGIVFYSLELHAQIRKNQVIGIELQKALENNEFYLMYQPQVDLKTGSLTGAEALIRWKNPALGNVRPDEFIPIAQQNGTLIPITTWVLNTACEQAAKWQQQGLPKVPISINVPSDYFQRPDFGSILDEVLTQTGLNSEYLEIEITERALVEETGEISKIYKFLAEKKIKLAIDDFGTGYSNLGYLPRFHIDKLKIDISFIRGLPSDNDSVTITTAIINLAHNLEIPVIAEGVETKAQVEFLQIHGCDNAQGFYYSKPLMPEDFAAYSKKQILTYKNQFANNET